MRKQIIVVLLFLVAIAACNLLPKGPALTGQDQLPSTFYTIDPTRDTVLTTARGAILTIAAGSLEAATPGSVRIEIKEAYSLEDIIRGRLMTTSHGLPLSSGGMIYINTVGNQALAIHKPIKVSIPTRSLQEGMQVYKGKADDKGNIDWVDPKALGDNPVMKDLAKGKAIFQGNCASCHKMDGSLTGPPLAWIGEREPDRKWLYDFIHNNQQMLCRGDAYSCYIYNRYNKTAMNLFPELSDVDIDRLLFYIDNESQTIDSATVPNYRKAFDSCARYLKVRDSLLRHFDNLSRRRDSLIGSNGRRIGNTMYDADGNVAGSYPLIVNKPLVRMVERPAIYYQFEIDSFGWYNVDILVKGLPGAKESELKVLIKGEYRKEADVFLVIPSLKLCQLGGLLEGKQDEFGFLTADGKIPLPQGVPALILCMGEYKGQAFFAKLQWITSLSQDLEIVPAAMTKEQINQAIAELPFDRLTVEVKDSKNADRIRAVDTLLNKMDSVLRKIAWMKPQFCDCDCGPESQKRDTAGIACPLLTK